MKLKDLFSFLTLKCLVAKAPETPQRRVFLVTDEEMKNECLAVVRDQVMHMNGILTPLFSGDDAGLQKNFGKENKVHKRIRALAQWPDSIGLWVREGGGITSGIRGPEITPHNGNIYLTVPDPDYHARQSQPDHHRLAAELRQWTPPPGVREMDKLLLGPSPFGVPTVIPDAKSLKQLVRRP